MQRTWSQADVTMQDSRYTYMYTYADNVIQGCWCMGADHGYDLIE